jgi:hypothetical protein
MDATATMTLQREPAEQARTRALVRFNGLVFHSLAIASLLESAAPKHAERLVRVFGAYPDVRLWLEGYWRPRRAALGAELAAYVEAIWPEFDRNSAWEEFDAAYRPRSGLDARDDGPALEALGACVSAAQAALFYRALAAGAEEPALRALARRAAGEHAGHFDCFRALFERCRRTGRPGFLASWRTAFAVGRSSRDGDVAAAHQALGGNWRGAPVVPALAYPEYRQRVVQFVRRHAAPGAVERLLLRPWIEPARRTPTATWTDGRPRWTRADPLPA